MPRVKRPIDPNDEIVHILSPQQQLEARISALEAGYHKKKPKVASDAREPKQKKKAKTISPTIKFIDRAGNDTELPRLKRSHKLSAEEHCARLLEAVKALSTRNIKPTSKNIKKLGIGAGTLQKFRKEVKAAVLGIEQQHKQQAAQRAAIRTSPLVPYPESSDSDSDEDSDSPTSNASPSSAPRRRRCCRTPSPSSPQLDPAWLPTPPSSPVCLDLPCSPLGQSQADPGRPDPDGLAPLPAFPEALAATLPSRPYLMAAMLAQRDSAQAAR